ncbi:MAG TPA: tetratricopeptide repeat protein, partial [Herpetosiphonaceae bacterium]|nr:tetratricopeptide repeat protein [Herpetosiphonaceae bacterium]
VLDRLAALADSGLLEYVEAQEPGFRMLETVREFALAKLESSGAESVRGRHAEYYLDLVQRAAPNLTGPHQASWAQTLEREYDNLRAALAWLRDNAPASALRMAVALEAFWTRYGHVREERAWLETLLERVTEPEPLRGRALVMLGSVLTEMGETDRADALLQEALAIYDVLEDPNGLPAVRFAQANAAHHRGDYPTARMLGEEALARYRELGDRLGTATTLQYLGSFALYEPDLERASLLLDESLQLYDAAGARQGQAMCTMLRGVIALFQGEATRAQALLSDSLRLSWELGDMWTVGRNLAAMALVVAARGEAERAAQLWTAAEALLGRIGVPLSAAGIPSVAAQQLAELRKRMGEDRWAEAERAGQGLTVERAVELALEIHPV